MIKLPVTTRIESIDIKSYAGQTIFELFEAISRQIKANKRTQELVKFFAIPQVNKVKNEINWFSDLRGVATAFCELDDSSKMAAEDFLRESHSALGQLADRLERASLGNKTISLAIRHLLTTPDLSNSLFKVGQEWVLTQWGCHSQGENSNYFTFEEQIQKIFPSKPVFETQPVPYSFSAPSEVVSATKVELLSQPNKQGGETEQHEPIPAQEPEISPEPERVAEPKLEQVAFEPRTLWRWLLLLVLLVFLVLGLMLLATSLWRKSHVGNEDNIRTEITSLWTQLSQKNVKCNVSSPADISSPEPDQSLGPTKEARNIGIETGVLNFALGWRGKSDLDLSVEEPSGQLINLFQPQSSSDGKLDIDSNRCISLVCDGNSNGSAVENISWSKDPPKGNYKVFVILYSAGVPINEIRDIPFTVEVSYGQKVEQKIQDVFKIDDILCEDRCRSKTKHLVAEFEIK